MKACESAEPTRALLSSLAVATVLMLPAGCTTLNSPASQASDPAQSASTRMLTQPQAELKLAFAQAAEQKGDLKQAMSSYQDLVNLDFGSADVHHRLALMYDRKGDSAQAEKHYLESLKQAPAAAKVLCDYGYSLYLRESFQAAEEQYRKAVEADPEYLRSRVNFGMLMARTGRIDQALHQFALSGLSEGEAHHNIALAATENGDTRTAVDALKMSQQADQGGASSGDHHALGQVVDRIAARRAIDSDQLPVAPK